MNQKLEQYLRFFVDHRQKDWPEWLASAEFAERMRKVQEETDVVLTRVQKEMKRQADRGRKKAEEWKVGDRVMLSIKDLVFKKRPAKKLVD